MNANREACKINPKPWNQTLFENFVKTYDKESFTQGTVGECVLDILVVAEKCINFYYL